MHASRRLAANLNQSILRRLRDRQRCTGLTGKLRQSELVGEDLEYHDTKDISVSLTTISKLQQSLARYAASCLQTS